MNGFFHPRRAQRFNRGFARVSAFGAPGIAAGISIIVIAGCSQLPSSVVGPSRTAGVEVQATRGGAGQMRVGRSASGNYLAGRLAHKLGDYSKAADFLAYSLKINPNNKSLLRRAYMVSIADGRLDVAVKYAEKLQKIDSSAPLAGITLAIEDIRKGDLVGAEKRLKSHKARGFNRYLVPLMLGWTLAGQGKPDDALAAMKPLKDYPGLVSIYRLHVGLLNDFADRTAEAEKALKAVSDKSKRQSLRIVQALGSIYERTGRPAEAAKLYKKYLKENPESLVLDKAFARMKTGAMPTKLVTSARAGVAEAFFNLAGSLTQDNSAQLALMFGRLALSLKPKFPIAQLLVGGILEALKRNKEAIEVYDAIPADSPMKWTARLRTAATLNAMDKDKEAIRRLRGMADEQKHRTEALIDLGDILRARKRFKQSVEAYDLAVARVPKIDKRHWAILYSRGISLERSKQWSRAEKDFLQALTLNPEQPYVLNYLGYTWVDQGVNIPRARKMIERAVALRPNDGYIVDSLGWALYRIKDFGGAVKNLERAVELRPQDPTINDHLGDAYWRVGRLIEARFQWRRALVLDPEPEMISKIKKKVERGLTAADGKKSDGS